MRKDYHKNYREQNREKRQKWNRDWIAKNKNRYNASKYIYRDNLKRQALSQYSNRNIKCIKCGEADIDILCLDHINDDGASHRKKLKISSRGGGAGVSTYAALKKHKWPPGFQILCANCNLKKEILRKHQERMKNPYYSLYIEKGVMPSVKHNQFTMGI